MRSTVRDTVFISYSHRDATWLERVLTFLKPYTRNGKLTVWADPYIRVGDVWRREIDGALDRAAVGLLLVSQDFIASDFIDRVELPALVTAADAGLLTLVCVPVSACVLSETRLAEFQWPRSPDQPLDLLSEPERNAELVKVAKAVEEAAARRLPAPAREAPAPPAPARREAAPVARRKRGAEGDLHDVPDLPPHYLPREEELGRLRDALLEGRSGALGITDEPYRMGLHGQGGIGKSVLAAALARDRAVRRAFPGGVFWVTVGQAPDLPRLQAGLLAEAGGGTASITDAQQGRELLEERFRRDTVLLVLDDVWDHRHARAFDVLGPASRLLLTTRDGAVLTALGAERETVQRLGEKAALSLLASWAGADPVSMPAAARGVAQECGYLPLALSVAGAKVRDGMPWETVSSALEHGRLEFLEHPYSSVFRSMRLSVDALSAGERERYLELAVFPEDERVPERVVLALWRRTAGLDELAGQDLLVRLRGKALLDVASTDGRRDVTLHDLQHDFLRISARDLPALHGELLTALAADLPAADGCVEWWRLPPGDRYSWVYLPAHLAAAGRTEELRDLLFDCRWLEAKLRAAGLPALLADFDSLPRDEELSLVAGALRLSGHVLGGDPGQLRSQLTARLLGMDRPRIRQMLCEAAASATGPWLRPASATLTPPTGALLRTLTGHARKVRAVALAGDGRRAVSGSSDGTLKVWALDTGVAERTLTAHQGAVVAVALTQDGRRAVSGAEDGTLKVWELDSGAEERVLTAHAGRVVALALTADGQRAVTGSMDGKVTVWNVESGAAERELRGHSGGVLAVALTADGRRAVSGSTDRTLKVWNLETGLEERVLVGHTSGVRAVAMSAEGRLAVSVSADGILKVWDLETGAEGHTLASHADWVRTVAVTANGRRAVSGSYNGTVTVWDVESGLEERTFWGHADGVSAVALTGDGRRAVTGSSDGTVKVWGLEGGTEERVQDSGRVMALALTMDGRRAVTGFDDGTVRVWNVVTGAEEATLAGYEAGALAVAFTGDGRHAVTGYFDGRLGVWDVEAGTEERSLGSDARPVPAWGRWVRSIALAVTPDGRRAVSGWRHGTVRLWDVGTGAEKRTLGSHGDAVLAVALTADGRLAVSGSSNGTLKVWDLEAGMEKRGPDRHAGRVRAVALTPDGRRAVSGSEDRTLKVWDVETGTEEHTLTGHAGRVRSVALTADGQRAASCSDDRTLKVWDLESGGILATFAADEPLECCAIAPDGVRLLAADRLGRVHMLVLEGLPPE